MCSLAYRSISSAYFWASFHSFCMDVTKFAFLRRGALPTDRNHGAACKSVPIPAHILGGIPDSQHLFCLEHMLFNQSSGSCRNHSSSSGSVCGASCRNYSFLYLLSAVCISFPSSSLRATPRHERVFQNHIQRRIYPFPHALRVCNEPAGNAITHRRLQFLSIILLRTLYFQMLHGNMGSI